MTIKNVLLALVVVLSFILPLSALELLTGWVSEDSDSVHLLPKVEINDDSPSSSSFNGGTIHRGGDETFASTDHTFQESLSTRYREINRRVSKNKNFTKLANNIQPDNESLFNDHWDIPYGNRHSSFLQKPLQPERSHEITGNNYDVDSSPFDETVIKLQLRNNADIGNIQEKPVKAAELDSLTTSDPATSQNCVGTLQCWLQGVTINIPEMDPMEVETTFLGLKVKVNVKIHYMACKGVIIQTMEPIKLSGADLNPNDVSGLRLLLGGLGSTCKGSVTISRGFLLKQTADVDLTISKGTADARVYVVGKNGVPEGVRMNAAKYCDVNVQASVKISNNPFSGILNSSLVNGVIEKTFRDSIAGIACKMVNEMVVSQVNNLIGTVTTYIDPFLREPTPAEELEFDSSDDRFIHLPSTPLFQLVDYLMNSVFAPDVDKLNCLMDAITNDTGDLDLDLMPEGQFFNISVPTIADISVNIPKVSFGSINTWSEFKMMSLSSGGPFEIQTSGQMERMKVNFPVNFGILPMADLIAGEPIWTQLVIYASAENPHGKFSFRPVIVKERTEKVTPNDLFSLDSALQCAVSMTESLDISTFDAFMGVTFRLVPGDAVSDPLETQLGIVITEVAASVLEPFSTYITDAVRGLAANMLVPMVNQYIQDIRPTAVEDCEERAPPLPPISTLFDWAENDISKLVEYVFFNILDGPSGVNRAASCLFPSNSIGTHFLETPKRSFLDDLGSITLEPASSPSLYNFFDSATGPLHVSNPVREVFAEKSTTRKNEGAAPNIPETENGTGLPETHSLSNSSQGKKGASLESLVIHGLNTFSLPVSIFQPQSPFLVDNVLMAGSFSNMSSQKELDEENPLSRAPMAVHLGLNVPTGARTIAANVTVYMENVLLEGSLFSLLDQTSFLSLPLQKVFSPCVFSIFRDISTQDVKISTDRAELYFSSMTVPDNESAFIELQGVDFTSQMNKFFDLVSSVGTQVVNSQLEKFSFEAPFVCNGEELPQKEPKSMDMMNIYFLIAFIAIITLSTGFVVIISGDDGSKSPNFLYRLVCCSWFRRVSAEKLLVASDEVDRKVSSPTTTATVGATMMKSDSSSSDPHDEAENTNPGSKKGFFCSEKIRLVIRIGIFLSLLLVIIGFALSSVLTGAQVSVQVLSPSNAVKIGRIFSFTVVQSIRDMYEAGVYGLFILVTLMSGIWPYVKLLLLLGCWVLPERLLSEKRREFFLVWLDRLGKWSMVDSFVLTMMVVAFRFKVPIIPDFFVLDVLVHSEVAFYLFVVATMGSLILSHILLAYHRQFTVFSKMNLSQSSETTSQKTSLKDHNHKVCLIPGTHALATKLHANREKMETRARTEKTSSTGHPPIPQRSMGTVNLNGKYTVRMKCTQLGKIFVPFTLVLCCALLIWAVTIDTYTFTFQGMVSLFMDDDQKNANYSLLSLTQALTGKSDTPNDAGLIFIQVVVLLFAFIVPLIVLAMITLLWFLPMNIVWHRKMHVFLEVAIAWSAIDVYLVSCIGAVTQISVFSQFIIGWICEPLGPILEKFMDQVLEGNPRCFDMKASFLVGVWVLVVAAVCFVFSTLVLSMVSHSSLLDRFHDSTKITRNTECIELSESERKSPPLESFHSQDEDLVENANVFTTETREGSEDVPHKQLETEEGFDKNSIADVVDGDECTVDNGGTIADDTTTSTDGPNPNTKRINHSSPPTDAGYELKLDDSVKSWLDGLYIQQLTRKHDTEEQKKRAIEESGLVLNHAIKPASLLVRFFSPQAWLGFFNFFATVGLIDLYTE